jgi:hypothetical protein
MRLLSCIVRLDISQGCNSHDIFWILSSRYFLDGAGVPHSGIISRLMRSNFNECLRTTLAITTLVSYTPNIKYSKHNRIRFKSTEERDKGRNMFTEFFGSVRKEELGKEMRGHIILDSTSDILESIILTFWETREDMDKFYSPQNKALASLVERAKPLFEKMPERTDYAVSELLLL